jgi:hypothetical protein
MEPTELLAMFDQPELKEVAREVENTLRRIMATAAAP